MVSDAKSREQWIEQMLDEAEGALRKTIMATVDAMIVSGALSVGPARTWHVVYDDPGCVAAYEFDVEAPSPELAMRKGTYLAALQDPNATMLHGAPAGGRPLAEREMIAAALAADAWQYYAVASETTEVEG